MHTRLAGSRTLPSSTTSALSRRPASQTSHGIAFEVEAGTPGDHSNPGTLANAEMSSSVSPWLKYPGSSRTPTFSANGSTTIVF